MPGGALGLPGAAVRSASRPELGTGIPRLRLGQVNDWGVPGPVIPPGGTRVGVPHGALEVAERPAGLEVQRRE
jgi:hypothetical protein